VEHDKAGLHYDRWRLHTLQHTATDAVCCSLLQSLAVCHSLLQSVAVCCSLLQSVAVCCSMLHDVAVCCSFYRIIDHVQMRMEREVSEWVRERKPKSGWWGGIGGGRSEMKHSHSNVAAILDFTIWVSLFLPPLNSPSPSPVKIILFGNTAKPAPMSPYTNYNGDFRLHDLSLFPAASPLLSFPFPDFFSILFGNTAKTALVSPLHQCHGVFRSRDLSLSPAPFLFFIFDSFRQHCVNSAGAVYPQSLILSFE